MKALKAYRQREVRADQGCCKKNDPKKTPVLF